MCLWWPNYLWIHTTSLYIILGTVSWLINVILYRYRWKFIQAVNILNMNYPIIGTALPMMARKSFKQMKQIDIQKKKYQLRFSSVDNFIGKFRRRMYILFCRHPSSRDDTGNDISDFRSTSARSSIYKSCHCSIGKQHCFHHHSYHYPSSTAIFCFLIIFLY